MGDPITADYYRSMIRTFNEMKDSPHPTIRAYWLAAHHRAQAASCAARVEKTLSGLLGGVEKVVRAYNGSAQTITFGYVHFRIQKAELSLEHGSSVHAQGFLTDTANAQRYAQDALPEDPAIRFSLRIIGTGIFGKHFSHYISAKRDITVQGHKHTG